MREAQDMFDWTRYPPSFCWQPPSACQRDKLNHDVSSVKKKKLPVGWQFFLGGVPSAFPRGSCSQTARSSVFPFPLIRRRRRRSNGTYKTPFVRSKSSSAALAAPRAYREQKPGASTFTGGFRCIPFRARIATSGNSTRLRPELAFPLATTFA